MNRKQEFSYDELLKPEIMLRLYASGAFPMADENTGEINWFMPEIRTIIPLNSYNIPRSLKKIMSKGGFEVRYDYSFEPVVRACAERDTTWISEELIKAYLKLEKKGNVHTVEIWKDDMLTGGLYGITYGGAFFGESMFSREPQASKLALVYLLEHLKVKGFSLLDVQYMTPHLQMFGAVEINFTEYNQLLWAACQKRVRF